MTFKPLKKPEKAKIRLQIKPVKYYIVANVNNKLYVDGGYDTDSEARAVAWKSLQGYVWDIIAATSANQALVTQQSKHRILEESHNPAVATQNAIHKLK